MSFKSASGMYNGVVKIFQSCVVMKSVTDYMRLPL